MTLIKDKLWNWGHLEGSHNGCTRLRCSMTPEEFAEEYGIPNAFMVSYGGNIQPPFAPLAKRLSGLGQIKWSVLGDASTPLPETELGNTEDILEALEAGGNITGGVVDDFFSPERMERFTPEMLKKIRACLNAQGLDFWCVLYAHQLDLELAPYMDAFDGVTFWHWNVEEIDNLEENERRLRAIIGNKPLMLGLYLWDYAAGREMDPVRFTRQLEHGLRKLKSGDIEGVVFCSSTVGDAPLETNRILKATLRRCGQDEIE